MSNGYQRPGQTGGALRLHLNEHTGGCSPKVLQRLRELDGTDASFYPDYARAVTRAAAWFGVHEDEFVLTNGMDEGIFAATILALRGREAAEGIVIEPAFEVYEACVRCLAGRPVSVTLPQDFVLRAEDVVAAVTPNTRIIFINAPHNPSGAAVPPDTIEEVAAAAPDALVFVDEAYVEFARDSFTGRAPWSHNVLVGRTFAKAFGLAGLRLGAVIGPPHVIQELKTIVPPFSINSFGAAALVEALDDMEYVQDYIAQAARSRDLIYQFCARKRLKAFPSDANFVLVRIGARATEVTEALARRGILVRDRSGQPNCAGCIRITAGLVEHTEAALAALEEMV